MKLKKNNKRYVNKNNNILYPITISLFCVIYVIVEVFMPVIKEEGFIGIIAFILLPLTVYIFIAINVWLNKT